MAMRIDSRGYKQVWLSAGKHSAVRRKRKKRGFLFHRLLFRIFHGYLPKYLDHINRNKLDNRLRNLRPITFAENIRNATAARNPSGYRNITIDRSKPRPFQVRVTYDKVMSHLGGYASLRAAVLVRNRFRRAKGLPV